MFSPLQGVEEAAGSAMRSESQARDATESLHRIGESPAASGQLRLLPA